MGTNDELPHYSPVDELVVHHRRRRHRRRRFIRLALLVCAAYGLYSTWSSPRHEGIRLLSAEKLERDHAHCAKLRSQPQDPRGPRERNARFVEGQKPVLIRNATVWTGEPSIEVTAAEERAGKGYEWIRADVLLRHGLIVRVESSGIEDRELPENCTVFDARGRQVTAGIVDMHSHAGVDGLPELRGNSDTNELSDDITPYVRSLDGFNPLEPHIQVVKSGGVTTSLILPGSGNNMGGEAYVVKLSVGKADGRPELSIASMLADLDHTHRYMKMACGENAKSVYGRVGRSFGPFSRLGEAWYFRHAFEQAAKLKEAQDDWCDAADRLGSRNMQSYLPLDLKWESLSAVLRGQVMVNTHCYTVQDLETFIGFTNEFKFPVRAFHHAHSTYLVPEVLKRVYGGRPPAAALFADNMNYKAESYIASEQAGRILYDAGLTPVYVSDNPVINSQHVLFEAAKAYKNGLRYHAALAGVTSASAELLGLGERIGKVKPGFDADVVVWDSDPLSLGATPVQVFIDGVPQIANPVELFKPLSPPLEYSYQTDIPVERERTTDIAFTGIKRFLIGGHEEDLASDGNGTVVIKNGSIVCIGDCYDELQQSKHVIHLKDGHIAPALTAFGSQLGLEEIEAEDVTSDGANDQSSFSAAVDGLALEGKNLHAAFSHGVTRAISAPRFDPDGHKGISAGFRIGARHALETQAVFDAEVALHYSLLPGAKQGKTPSISAVVGELRAKLRRAVVHSQQNQTEDIITTIPEDIALAKVIAGKLPLVIDVHSADVIATLLRVKSEIDHLPAKPAQTSSTTTTTRPALRLVLLGGAESHLLAEDLARANVSVILTPLFAYATSWDQRRSLSGAPLTNGTAIDVLHAAGVQLAIGVNEDWEARDLLLHAGTVMANSGGRIGAKEALALASSAIYEILGLAREGEEKRVGRDFVVFEGDPLTINGQVRAVSDGRGWVTVWE